MEQQHALNPSLWPRLIITTYQEAGWPAYATTLVFVLLAASLPLIWQRAKESGREGLLGLVVGAPLFVGLLGYAYALQRVHEALLTVSPEFRERLLQMGRGEAIGNVYIGAVLSLLLGGVYAALAARNTSG